MKTTDPAVLLSAADVAQMLSVTVRHVRSLDSSGRLPRPIRLGRSVRWQRDEIIEWLNAGAPHRDRWETIRRKLYDNATRSHGSRIGAGITSVEGKIGKCVRP